MKKILILMLAITSLTVFGQVGVGTTNPHGSSILDVTSTTLGFLPPRMTTAQRDAIVSPATGLIIYNITKACMEYYNSLGWYNPCDGTSSGLVGSGGTAVVTSWTSTIGCAIGAGTNNSPAGVRQAGVNETMVAGTAAPATASITMVADVTTVGTYNIFTNTVNGVSFAASGTFPGTGSQTITLTPTGTPLAAGNYKWILGTGLSVYGSVLTATAPVGSTYTTHYNGIIAGVSVDHTLATYVSGETFDGNTTCATMPVSAQGCNGITSVTGSGGTYATVAINGQCWLQTNLNETPSVYNTYTTTSWTNTSPDDQGYWGYYHTTDTTGASGWQSTVPAANEGLLYQWCAAMDATISERSKGSCPAGWHIPSDCEWMYLEHGQGMSITEQQIDGSFRADIADNQGTPCYKLRSQGTGQTNASGFSGLLAGFRFTAGDFQNNTQDVSFWSSLVDAANSNAAYFRTLENGARGVMRQTISNANAFSVRCLKD